MTGPRERSTRGRGRPEIVGRRTDQKLIAPARLAELERLAQDGRDLRAALRALDPKRYALLEVIRTAPLSVEADRARSWLEHESDLGDALLALVEKKGLR